MPTTRVIREPSSAGKAGEETMSLYVLCGSAVMRQIVVVGEELRECGTAILPGLRRLLSVMCFFVVSWNQIATLWSSSSSSPDKRFGLESLVEPWALLICFKSALEALRV